MKASKGAILLVEDDPDQRKGIAHELKHEGFDVEEAGGIQEAQRLLDSKPFDIVVCDMKMETAKAGLDLVAFLHPMRSPYHTGLDTIFIIYTAWETFPDCVKAIKQGAYDYICKNEDNSIDHLIRACVEGLKEKTQWAAEPDYEFVQKNWEKLLKQFGEQWIAVRGREIIAHSQSLSDLYNDIRKRFPQAKPFIVHLEKEPALRT